MNGDVLSLGWPVASAIASVALAAVYLSSLVIKSIASRIQTSDKDKHEDDLIRIALFGRPAEPPLEPISGLIADNKATKAAIDEIQHHVATVEREVSALRTDVGELLSRTTENGGSSLKDQMNRIETRVNKNA